MKQEIETKIKTKNQIFKSAKWTVYNSFNLISNTNQQLMLNVAINCTFKIMSILKYNIAIFHMINLIGQPTIVHYHVTCL